jgi:2,3-bisphosphoglycerate-independent phosphoglycerate mutase
VDSPKDVATYDLKPQMSALQVCDKLIAALNSKKYEFLVCNFANPDMVGHTGNLQATIEALQTVDACVGKILDRVDALGIRLLLTSDHGNADEMIADNGEPSTAHSLNPVCMAVYEQGRVLPLSPKGRLADIAPTILHLWGIAQPSEMTGCNLVPDMLFT